MGSWMVLVHLFIFLLSFIPPYNIEFINVWGAANYNLIFDSTEFDHFVIHLHYYVIEIPYLVIRLDLIFEI